MIELNSQSSELRKTAKAVVISALWVLISHSAVYALPTLTVGTASGQAGTTVNLPISFDPSTSSVAGIQFNLTLPASLSTGTVTPGAIVTSAGKSISTNKVGSTWIFLVTGFNQTTISSGSLLTAQLLIAPGTAAGTLSVAISGVIYSDLNGNSVPPGTSTGGTITVNPPSPVVTSTGTAIGQVGVAFSYQIAATNSPTSFNATPLPAGLSINTATGLISGTPTTAATTSVTLGATNAGGTGTKPLSLTINPATPVVTSTGTAIGQVGVAFSYQIAATNSPTSFNATPLPAGLAINTATGLISGTPTTTGVTSVTLSAINAGGTGTKILSLTINPATPVVTSTGTAIGQVGVAFSYTIAASNSPTSFNASPLPAGLSINAATGLISGTPTTSGVTTVTLSATNAGGTGTKTLTVTINPATPVVTSATTATGTVGVAFSYQITATNSPTSFNATSLPSGLAVNTANGLISGTPVAVGISTVTLSATNAGGTGTATLTITILTAPPVITSPSSTVGKTGMAFLYQITATNNPTSFNATGLPSGLLVSSVSGLISGTPVVAGTSTVTLSATNAGGTGTRSLAMTIFSACDLNNDGISNVLDLQLEVNEALGITACTDDINKDAVCNVLDIQRIVNAALGGACVVGP